jgi:hypothetical protein
MESAMSRDDEDDMSMGAGFPRREREFHVTWKIDVCADNPEQAARLAWEIMRKPDSMADVFDVLAEGQEPVRIDLTEIDQERASA